MKCSRAVSRSVLAALPFIALCLLALTAYRKTSPHWKLRFGPGVEAATLSLSADGTHLVLSEWNGKILMRRLDQVGEIEVFGNSLDNLLTIDFSNGDPIPEGGLIYHGLDEETPEGDALAMVGREGGSGLYQPTAEKDGLIRIERAGSRGGRVSLIAFTGLEPVIDEIPGTLTMNGTPSANAINIGEAADTTRSRGTVDSFEYIDFKNKTTLTIQSMGGDDTVTVDEPTSATGLASIQVDGGGDNDTLNLVRVPVALTTTDVEELEVDGAGPGTAACQDLDIQGLIMNFDIAGTTPGTEHDQIMANNVNLSNSILQINPLFVPDPGMTFEIIDVGGTLIGNFLSLGEGDLLPGGINGVPASISYSGGDGNDVVLTTFNHQADIRVGKRADPASHGGNDLYGFAVAAQDLKVRMKGRQTRARFFFSAQNDSGTDGDILLYASPSRRGVQVQYYEIDPAARNVTGAILSALLFEDVQTPGDTFVFKAVARTPRGRLRDKISIRVQPVDDVRQIDRSVVRFIKR